MTVVAKVVDMYQFDAGQPGSDTADFKKAYAFGIRGVIHKASEGLGVTDRLYTARRPHALAAGLLWGAYHFIRPGSIQAQAQHFVTCANPDKTTLMALDHEDSNVSLDDAWLFVETVEALLRAKGLTQTVTLYSGFLIKAQIAGRSAEDKAAWATKKLWGCQYNSSWIHVDVNHQPLPWKDIWLWQFTGDGSGPLPHNVPGIQTNMDVNSYTDTDAQLALDWVS